MLSFPFFVVKSDILIIGGGASGLMAAYGAARTLVDAGSDLSVTVHEKMPRPARKVMITGKGRCNFTNVKDWNAFCGHIRAGVNLVKPSFYNFTPEAVNSFFGNFGLKTVVERGDRAFPASYHASDIVDTLVNACSSVGVRLYTESEVSGIGSIEGGGFKVSCTGGASWICRSLIIATGGLSYPTTGSTGDGLAWAEECGHRIVPVFPSLTAMVPAGYKIPSGKDRHIARETPLSEVGEKLCGIQLKNVGARLEVDGCECGSEFGDLDFTDGGIEGPIGFQLSRKAVKAMVNGSRAALSLDLKYGVDLTELTSRIKELWTEIDRDPRSRGVREKEKCRILLGKLLPWDLIPAFTALNPQIITLERKGRTDTKVWVNLGSIAKALKDWRFELAGYVGYERAVVTAGGVSAEDIVAKTLESRVVKGLHFCGEVLDVDCDTGGYNLQCAFCTGRLAGESAARKLLKENK